MATLSYYHCKRWSYHTIVKLFSISFYKTFIVVATKKRNGNWIRKYCSGSCQVNSSGPNQRLTHNRKGKVEDKWKERVVVKDEKEGIYKVKRNSKRKSWIWVGSISLFSSQWSTCCGKRYTTIFSIAYNNHLLRQNDSFLAVDVAHIQYQPDMWPYKSEFHIGVVHGLERSK